MSLFSEPTARKPLSSMFAQQVNVPGMVKAHFVPFMKGLTHADAVTVSFQAYCPYDGIRLKTEGIEARCPTAGHEFLSRYQSNFIRAMCDEGIIHEMAVLDLTKLFPEDKAKQIMPTSLSISYETIKLSHPNINVVDIGAEPKNGIYNLLVWTQPACKSTCLSNGAVPCMASQATIQSNPKFANHNMINWRCPKKATTRVNDKAVGCDGFRQFTLTEYLELVTNPAYMDGCVTAAERKNIAHFIKQFNMDKYIASLNSSDPKKVENAELEKASIETRKQLSASFI